MIRTYETGSKHKDKDMDDYLHIDEFKINITPEQLEFLTAKYKKITDLPLSDVVRNRLIVFAMDWIDDMTKDAWDAKQQPPNLDRWGRQSLN